MHIGGLAVAVPGEVRGYRELYTRFGGQIPWSDLLEPSIKLCEEGHTVNWHMAKALRSNRKFILNEPSMRISWVRFSPVALDSFAGSLSIVSPLGEDLGISVIKFDRPFRRILVLPEVGRLLALVVRLVFLPLSQEIGEKRHPTSFRERGKILLGTKGPKVPKKGLGGAVSILLVEVLVKGPLLHHLGFSRRDFVATGKAKKGRSQVPKKSPLSLHRGPPIFELRSPYFWDLWKRVKSF
ncbi:Glutathione hydrolase 1 proenzyme [Chionoecetes opilio]|uniref:Glutathione hydrolase 1 proenzyme n=1 Tax=Chionoecetes opilio TaxID=41210 RepID=A0A8J4XQW3_CHIOP|nr:Glutathione hydrolase 1 proenzyme [Chionoecetes opilio]